MQKNKEKTAPQSVHWMAGPSIAPLPELLIWLEANRKTEAGNRRYLRLPVVVIPPTAHALHNRYFIGVENALPESERIYLQMDDGAMGISFADRLRSLDLSESPVIWIEGFWGSLLEMPDKHRLETPFAVRRVESWEMEAPAGNAHVHLYWQ